LAVVTFGSTTNEAVTRFSRTLANWLLLRTMMGLAMSEMALIRPRTLLKPE